MRSATLGGPTMIQPKEKALSVIGETWRMAKKMSEEQKGPGWAGLLAPNLIVNC